MGLGVPSIDAMRLRLRRALPQRVSQPLAYACVAGRLRMPSFVWLVSEGDDGMTMIKMPETESLSRFIEFTLVRVD